MPEFEVQLATDRGLVRGNNEDYARAGRLLHETGAYQLWVVADGMGGGARGEVASRLAVDSVFEYLAEMRWSDPIEALTGAFTLANARVHERGTGGGEATRSAMGTTLVCALVHEDSSTVWLANVGDSRAYLINGRGLTQITEDHSLVGERVASGQLTEAQALEAEGRNVITRGIGPDERVEVDVFGPRALKPGERLLLCTDGLHGEVRRDDLYEICRRHRTADLPPLLVGEANNRGGKDNVTVLVGGIAGAPLPAYAGGGRRTRLLLVPVLGLALFGVVAGAVIAVGVRSSGEAPDERSETAVGLHTLNPPWSFDPMDVPPTAAAEPPATASPMSQLYTVAENDTCIKLAERWATAHGATYLETEIGGNTFNAAHDQALQDLNPEFAEICNPDRLVKGWEIKLPEANHEALTPWLNRDGDRLVNGLDECPDQAGDGADGCPVTPPNSSGGSGGGAGSTGGGSGTQAPVQTPPPPDPTPEPTEEATEEPTEEPTEDPPPTRTAPTTAPR